MTRNVRYILVTFISTFCTSIGISRVLSISTVWPGFQSLTFDPTYVARRWVDIVWGLCSGFSKSERFTKFAPSEAPKLTWWSDLLYKCPACLSQDTKEPNQTVLVKKLQRPFSFSPCLLLPCPCGFNGSTSC